MEKIAFGGLSGTFLNAQQHHSLFPSSHRALITLNHSLLPKHTVFKTLSGFLYVQPSIRDTYSLILFSGSKTSTPYLSVKQDLLHPSIALYFKLLLAFCQQRLYPSHSCCTQVALIKKPLMAN